MVYLLQLQPYTIAKSKTKHGNDHQYKIASGLDATVDEGTGVSDKERWKNGHVLTFWAYDYNYQGTTQYHVYNNNKTY